MSCNFGCGLFWDPVTKKLTFCGDNARGLECDPTANNGEGCWFVKIGCGLKYDDNGAITVDIPIVSANNGAIQNNMTAQYTSADGRVYNNEFCVTLENTTCNRIFYESNVNYGVGVNPVTPTAHIRYGVEASTDGGATWNTIIAHQSQDFAFGWQHKDSYYYRSDGATYPGGVVASECYRLWIEVLSGTVTWVDADIDTHFIGLGVTS